MTRVLVQPVRRLPRPAYPTRLEVLEYPDLLAGHIPYRWLSPTDLTYAVSFALAANLGGCTDRLCERAESTGPPPTAVYSPIRPDEAMQGQLADRAAFMGRMTFRRPPVYISEDEALQVIVDEMAAHGVRLSVRDVELDEVIIKGARRERRQDWITGNQSTDMTEISGPLELDLVDARLDVGVEYIDPSDTWPLGGGRAAGGSGPKSVAQSVAQAVNKQGRGGYFGALYYPGEEIRAVPPGATRELSEQRKAECERLLRIQIRGFIDWLKAQGVI